MKLSLFSKAHAFFTLEFSGQYEHARSLKSLLNATVMSHLHRMPERFACRNGFWRDFLKEAFNGFGGTLEVNLSPKIERELAVGVVFHHIDPYHYARVNAAADRLSVAGIEWSVNVVCRPFFLDEFDSQY